MNDDDRPVAINPAEAADDLKQIVELNRKIDRLKIKAYESAEVAKGDKKAVEAAQDELNDLIREISNPRPLLEPRPPADAEGAPAAAVHDAWRGEPLSVLLDHGITDKLMDKLIEGGIQTLGDVADCPDLTAIPGVGKAARDKIADAVAAYHAAHQEQDDEEQDDGEFPQPADEAPGPDPLAGAPRPFVVKFAKGRKKSRRHVIYARDAAEALHYASNELTFVEGVIPIDERDVEDSDVVAHVPEGYGATPAVPSEDEPPLEGGDHYWPEPEDESQDTGDDDEGPDGFDED